MVRRFQLIDHEFRRLAPLYANTVVIDRDGIEFHERDGLMRIIDAARPPDVPRSAVSAVAISPHPPHLTSRLPALASFCPRTVYRHTVY